MLIKVQLIDYLINCCSSSGNTGSDVMTLALYQTENELLNFV